MTTPLTSFAWQSPGCGEKDMSSATGVGSRSNGEARGGFLTDMSDGAATSICTPRNSARMLYADIAHPQTSSSASRSGRHSVSVPGTCATNLPSSVLSVSWTILALGSSRVDSTDLTPARTPDILTRALSRRPPRMSKSVFSANGGNGSLPTIFIEDAFMPGANASGVATPFTSMTSPSLNESAPSMCAVGVRCVSPEKYMPLPLGSATSAKTPDAERHPTTCVTTPVAQTSSAWAASVLVSAATSEKDIAASSMHVAVMSLFYQISCDFWGRGFQPRHFVTLLSPLTRS